jgi:hypothetical protein
LKKIAGILEVAETYVGGKPRKRGRGTEKTPVVLTIERGGKARAKKMKTLSAKNLRSFIQEHADENATIMTDGYKAYNGLRFYFKGA